jgi:hypothetical protein
MMMVWMGSILAMVAGAAAEQHSPGDKGYFLTLQQKGQLLWRGRMQDSNEDWYDVWICPGYVAPTRDAKDAWQEAMIAFREYADAEKYEDMAEEMVDAVEWAYDDALWEFALEGTGKAWKEHFSQAQERSRRRVFGWWMAYPWALLKSTVETGVRIPCGAAGAGIGTGWGLVVVPAWHLTNSGIEGCLHAVVEGGVLPATQYAWNTIATPPLALVGERPAPTRVDGFWVRRVTPEEARGEQMRARVLNYRERKEWIALAVRLHEALAAETGNIKRLEEEKAARIEAVRKEYGERLRDLRDGREAKARQLLAAESASLTAETDRMPTREGLAAIQGEINSALREGGADWNESRDVYRLLLDYAAKHAADNPPARPKTDPVRTSLDTIDEID